MDFTHVDNGVCAPIGFYAGGIHCGIRRNTTKLDLALIVSEDRCTAAAVYTQNKVCGAPIVVTRKNLGNGFAQAVIVNSGNANTCQEDGISKAITTCLELSNRLMIDPEDVIVASTGVIGQPLPIDTIVNGLDLLIENISNIGSDDAALAIMTTDTIPKSCAIEFKIDDKLCRIGCISKGTGMIHPDMATMLCFITTDVDISAPMLQAALKSACDDSYNMISVDGDTSTNDMMSIMANGCAGNKKITSKTDKNYLKFALALKHVCVLQAKKSAGDGEGATKLLECIVRNARTDSDARKCAKAVISSNLVKTAMFGKDANWGRILCALGYSQTDINVNKIDVSFTSSAGSIQVCKNGSGLDFSEDDARRILQENTIVIDIDLGIGSYNATAWGCDLTYDYVKINGDYRT